LACLCRRTETTADKTYLQHLFLHRFVSEREKTFILLLLVSLRFSAPFSADKILYAILKKFPKNERAVKKFYHSVLTQFSPFTLVDEALPYRCDVCSKNKVNPNYEIPVHV